MGVIGYAADTTLAFVGGAVLGPGAVSAEYKINVVQPTRCEALLARGMVIVTGKRQTVCRCEVFAVADEQKYLRATAQGTVVRRSPPKQSVH